MHNVSPETDMRYLLQVIYSEGTPSNVQSIIQLYFQQTGLTR